MSERTFQAIVAEAAWLTRVGADAARQGIEVGELLGVGGYGAVFAARAPGHGRAVLKLPWCGLGLRDEHPDVVEPGLGPNRVELVSATGPFVLRSPVGLAEAAEVLSAMVEAYRERGGDRPLVRLFDVPMLDGLPAALLERAEGRPLGWTIEYWPDEARALIPGLARTLLELHRGFGAHGDLKPAHVVTGKGGIVLLDPLGAADWIGSIGYALPLPPGPDEARAREQGELRDLGALAQILASMWGGTLGWSGRLAYWIVNQGNGRFGRGLDWGRVERDMVEGSAAVPEPYRAWVLEAARAVVARAQGGALEPGWCRGRLEALAASGRT